MDINPNFQKKIPRKTLIPRGDEWLIVDRPIKE
jgi:hypothetical protein